jgi:hypothetical protein
MDTLTRLEGRAADWLVRDYRRRAEQEAVRRAYVALPVVTDAGQIPCLI